MNKDTHMSRSSPFCATQPLSALCAKDSNCSGEHTAWNMQQRTSELLKCRNKATCLSQSHMLVSQEWSSLLSDVRRFTEQIKSQSSSLLKFDTPSNSCLAPFHAPGLSTNHHQTVSMTRLAISTTCLCLVACRLQPISSCGVNVRES